MSDSDLLKAISEIREGWQLQEKIDKAEETLRQKKMTQYAEQARKAEGQSVRQVARGHVRTEGGGDHGWGGEDDPDVVGTGPRVLMTSGVEYEYVFLL